MKYNSIEAFVPSGKDFHKSRQLFLELGFNINRESDDYVGFEKDNCKFILQNFDDEVFARNFMLSVKVDDLDEFWQEISEKNLPEKFGIKLNAPKNFPWGREVILIDIAGVCWHLHKENKHCLTGAQASLIAMIGGFSAKKRSSFEKLKFNYALRTRAF